MRRQYNKKTAGTAPMSAEAAFSKLAALCARGEHCSGEMDEKMLRWNMEDADRQSVLERLKKEKYVDDERYARAFIHDKINYDKWGRRKIEQALRMKQVAEADYLPALDAVSEDEWLEALRPLIKQKMETTKGRNDYERATKTIKYAMGRGYTLDIIRKCIDEADYEEEE